MAAGAALEARHRVRGGTPLHTAAFRNQEPAIITALAEHGAAVNATDLRGRTPLDLAHHPAVIAALRAAGAECGQGSVFSEGICQSSDPAAAGSGG